MGEAWFMSPERKMYSELLGDLSNIPINGLQTAMVEIASGTSSFGSLDGEWRQWFHYLLLRLLDRSHESYVTPLLEIVITAFFSQYPIGISAEPYPEFRRDALKTVGQSLMDPICWPDGVLDLGVCFGSFFAEPGPWFGTEASGVLSASLFFCLKYLEVQELRPWLDSVLTIADPRWRAQITIWLVGAHRMLSGSVRQPSALSRDDYPKIDWEWSHCLQGDYSGRHGGDGRRVDFTSETTRLEALEAIKAHFSEAKRLEWLASFASDPELETGLGSLPYWLFELYAPAG